MRFWCSFGAVLVQFWCSFEWVVQFWCKLHRFLVQLAPPFQSRAKTVPKLHPFLNKNVFFYSNMLPCWFILETWVICWKRMIVSRKWWLLFWFDKNLSYFFQYSLTCIKMVAALHHICVTTAPYIYPQHKLLLKSVPNHEQADPKREERPRWFPEGEGITGPKYVRFIGNIVKIVFMNKRGEVTSICHLDSEINNNQMWPSSSDGLHSESP